MKMTFFELHNLNIKDFKVDNETPKWNNLHEMLCIISFIGGLVHFLSTVLTSNGVFSIVKSVFAFI